MVNLRVLRAKLNISQQKLADDCNITKSSVSLYENGLRNPSSEVLVKISKKYNVSIDWLLKGE